MTLEDKEPIRYEQQGFDADFAAALDVLKQLSQAEVAAQIGISDRRLRDIERGRSRPRAATRDAILTLADEVRAGAVIPRTGGSSKDPGYMETEQSAGWTPLVVLGLFLLPLVAPLVFGLRNRSLTLPVVHRE